MLIANAQLLDRPGLWDVVLEGERIVEVLEAGAVTRCPTNLDARGGLLLPDLHDHHLHLRALAAHCNSLQCGLPKVTDRESLRDLLRAANPDMMDLVRSWVTANRQEVYHTVYRVLAEGVAEIIAPNPPISRPALVITGDEDFGNGPEMTRAIAAEIAGAEALILPGLRHMALAEDPASINDPLRAFLGKHMAAA